MHIVSACGWFLNGISFAVGRLFLSAAWPSTPFSSFLFCFFSGLLPPQSPVINNALNILIVAQGSNCIDRCVWRARFSSQYPRIWNSASRCASGRRPRGGAMFDFILVRFPFFFFASIGWACGNSFRAPTTHERRTVRLFFSFFLF